MSFNGEQDYQQNGKYIVSIISLCLSFDFPTVPEI